MDEVRYHPIDFDALRKGDVITVEQLERITGYQYGTRKFDLAVLALREQITRELHDRNYPITVASENGSLKILTDEEAAAYNPQMFRHGFRKLLRAHRRLMNVDATQLNSEQREALERNIVVQGKMISAARSSRQIALQSHKRATPGLPAPAAT